MTPFTVACVQTNASRTLKDNLETVNRLVREARDRGADFILTPENVAILEPKSEALRSQAEVWDGNSVVAAFAAMARDAKAWLLAGSLPIKAPSDKVFNRSVLFDDRGAVVSYYDKIHLFDVDLPSGERYRESSTFEAGNRAVIAETPWGPVGFSICYDVRFPHLYRELAQSGARYLFVPSAFTKTTGEAHWHVLLRARAIEAGAFVFAPAQTGTHAENRRTFGHSLIVDPWGTVLADGGDDVGVITALIDPALVDKARGQVPAINHQPAFTSPKP